MPGSRASIRNFKGPIEGPEHEKTLLSIYVRVCSLAAFAFNCMRRGFVDTAVLSCGNLSGFETKGKARGGDGKTPTKGRAAAGGGI